MASDRGIREVQEDNHEDALYAEIAPYMADPDMIRKIIHDAMISGEPADYLEKLINRSEGSLKIDLRIVLNRLEKKF